MLAIFTFNEIDLLDATNPSITLDEFYAFNNLRKDFWYQIVRINDQGFEQSGWRYLGGELISICGNTHDAMLVEND